MPTRSRDLPHWTQSYRRRVLRRTGTRLRLSGGATRPGAPRRKRRHERLRCAAWALDQRAGRRREAGGTAHRRTRHGPVRLFRCARRRARQDADRGRCHRRHAERRHVHADDAVEGSLGPHRISDLPARRQRCGDMVMVADPTTFRVLPWSPQSGWILCDLYSTDGTPHPFSTRALMCHMLDRLDKQGLSWRAGLEVEFHLLKLTDATIGQDHIAMPGPSPKVALLNHGYQYLTEQRYDAIEPLMEMLRGNLQALGLPLRSLEIEFGPSQVEVTFGAVTGIQSADNMLLF